MMSTQLQNDLCAGLCRGVVARIPNPTPPPLVRISHITNKALRQAAPYHRPVSRQIPLIVRNLSCVLCPSPLRQLVDRHLPSGHYYCHTSCLCSTAQRLLRHGLDRRCDLPFLRVDTVLLQLPAAVHNVQPQWEAQRAICPPWEGNIR